MDLFSFIKLGGGLAFFLYGIHVMSTGLEKMAGGKLEKALKKMTSNPFMSLLFGAGVTIAIQSSSAFTVMLVGLVNSGIMQFSQTIFPILGADVGTTVTTWISSTVGIKGDNVFLNFLKPANFSLVFALIAVILIMASKSAKKKDIGSVIAGFSILMYGMTLMSDSVSPLADSPAFSELLTAFKNPILGVLVGALVTGVIQSSAASIAILQVLAATAGGITYGMAIPIIMGQNIGTCVTAIISSIGVSREAKKVSFIHITIKIIGTLVMLPLYIIFDAIFKFAFTDFHIGPLGIALVHTVYNLLLVVLLIPFSKQLVKLTNFFIRDKGGKKSNKKQAFLDERLFATPSVAIAECSSHTKQMAVIARTMMSDAMGLVNKYDEDKVSKLLENEELLDRYEDKLGTYLVRISSEAISDSDTRKTAKMLHVIGDFERLGDHALNILNVAKELHQKELSFSDKAVKELSVLTSAIDEILDITFKAYKNNDIELATKVEPLEQVIDHLISDIRDRHINRLQKGECTIELGFILSDLLTNYERISDHCSNIAVAIIEVSHNTFDTHKYLNGVKYGNSKFNNIYNQFDEKYSI